MKAFLGSVFKGEDFTMTDHLCVPVAPGTKVRLLLDRWDLQHGKKSVEEIRGTLAYGLGAAADSVPGLRVKGSWHRLAISDVCLSDDKASPETMHVTELAGSTRLARIVPEGALLQVIPSDQPHKEIGRLSYQNSLGPTYINQSEGEELHLLESDSIEVLSTGPADCTFCKAKGKAIMGLCDSCAKLRHELTRIARKKVDKAQKVPTFHKFV